MKTYIISNIKGGGSEKYVTDLMNRYPITLIQNKTQLNSINYSDGVLLLVQQLFFTGITPKDLLYIKKKYQCRIIICIHDFCWFHDTKYEHIYLESIQVDPYVDQLFKAAEYVIHPSRFTKDIYMTSIPHRAIVHPHNDIIQYGFTKHVPQITTTINIGVPHAFSDYKGKENIQLLMKYTSYKNYNLRFFIVGHNVPMYTEKTWPAFYSKMHGLLHLNKYGETYCYTLTKSINSGLPILYNNIGAFKERMPVSDHYFKVIDHETDYSNESLLKSSFESMLNYIIQTNGQHKSVHYNTDIYYHPFYDSLFKPGLPFTLLLTSTVTPNISKGVYQTNPDERIQTYLKSIEKWLQYTSFNIVLVENSNYKFTELQKLQEQYSYKFEYITFDESSVSPATYKSRSKGVSEMYAIHYAYANSIFLKQAIYIIKVTARFFIPELECYLKTIPLNYDCIVQHDIDRCEMIGVHVKHFNTIFNYKICSDHVEHYYKTMTCLFKTLKCKKFFIENTQRGGVNEKFNSI